MTRLHTRALTVTIGGQRICDGLDLAINRGERWAILGRNGAGKTTLLHTLAGLRAPADGAVHLDSRPLADWPRRARARRIGLLPQDSSDPFPATVLETALMGRHPHLGPWAWEGPTDVAAARAALLDVGLAALEARSVQTLSGGERRRLALALLLCQNPQVYLLDEPVNHLDLHHRIQLLERLGALCAEGASVAVTLHEPDLAIRFCSHALLLLDNGETAHGPIGEVVDEAALSRLYHHPIRAHRVDGRTVFLPD